MRIVAGKYGSRSLKSPKNDATRPTQDKIKGAIFSSLGNIFDGGNFLDLQRNWKYGIRSCKSRYGSCDFSR